jgi:hypothetical protein
MTDDNNKIQIRRNWRMLKLLDGHFKAKRRAAGWCVALLLLITGSGDVASQWENQAAVESAVDPVVAASPCSEGVEPSRCFPPSAVVKQHYYQE